MKPVMMLVQNQRNGDCFRACLASILEYPIECIPNFGMYNDVTWFKEAAKWLGETLGLGLLAVDPNDTNTYHILMLMFDRETYYVACGKGPRGPHACVGRCGKIVHDPSPLGGDLESHDLWMFLVMLNPAKAVSDDDRRSAKVQEIL